MSSLNLKRLWRVNFLSATFGKLIIKNKYSFIHYCLQLVVGTGAKVNDI